MPNFIILTHPLYEAAKGPLTEPLDLIKPVTPAFSHLTEALQWVLLKALALALPEHDQPFILCTIENWGMVLGDFRPMRGFTFVSIAYLSKRPDSTVRDDSLATGISSCLPISPGGR